VMGKVEGIPSQSLPSMERLVVQCKFNGRGSVSRNPT
jgi:hypothetical protein